MALIYAKGGDLAMEDRFYRPLALVLLIGIVEAVATTGRAVRLPLGALAAATMVYGISSYAVRLEHNRQAPMGSRGFHQNTLSHDGLALMRRELAGVDEDTVVWSMMPEIALETGNARRLISAEPERELGIRTYSGRAKRLLVFVNQTMIDNGKADIVLRSFRDYDRSKWVATRLGDSTVFAQ